MSGRASGPGSERRRSSPVDRFALCVPTEARGRPGKGRNGGWKGKGSRLDLAISGRYVALTSWPVALGQIDGARGAGRTVRPVDGTGPRVVDWT